MNRSYCEKTIAPSLQGVASILTVLVLLLTALALDTSPVKAATTYYVNKDNPACSDEGSGTLTVPFCTIGHGADVATVPGDIVKVVAGTYAESVYPAGSGNASFPITFLVDPGVTVTVTGNPAAAPGTGFGFGISSRSYVVVDGFHFTGTKANAIFVTESNHITIRNNHVSLSGDPANPALHVEGIVLKNADYSTVHNNISNNNTCYGIRLIEGSDNNTVSNNVVYGNASAVISDAAGIEMYGSSYNTIKNNIVYGNEDSGIDMYIMSAVPFWQSTNNVVVGNLVYGNGDHGIDNNNSPYNTVIGNTVHGNGTAGINFEGEVGKGSHHGTIMNNIMSGNGLTPPSYSFGGNLRVDLPSREATVANYNLYFKEGVQSVQILWNDNVAYATLAAFKAAVGGQEANGLEGNPQFVAPAPNVLRTETPRNGYVIPVVTGDYHLKYNSPAIDNANAGVTGWLSADIQGNPRFDAPWVVNTGTGTRVYDDRGAYEMQQPTCYALTISAGVHGSTPVASPLKSVPCASNGQYLPGEVIGLSGAVPESSDYAITGWTGTDNNASIASTNTVTMPAEPRTAGVTYTAVYHPPVITEGDVPLAIGMSEDGSPAAFSLTLHASDIVSPTLTWSISSAATQGVATASGTGLSKVIGYTPTSNYNGPDSFMVKVTDGNPAWDDTITVNVTIASINDPPVCIAVPISTTEDTVGSASPSCTDVDLDVLSLYSVTAASHGASYIQSGSIKYLPDPNYSGSDSFNYTVRDPSFAESAPAAVNVTVSGVNDAPVITEGSSTSVTMSEDGAPTAFNLTLHATDPEGDTITWSVSSGAAHGTAGASGTGTSKVISYAPQADYAGPDSFTIQATDGVGTSSIVVNVTVNPVNDAPVITEGVSVPVTMSEDGSPIAFALTLNATDVESNTITWSITTPAGHGTASASGTGPSKVISYTPTADYNGPDNFVVTISDGNGGSDTIAVNVTINPVDDAPIITQGVSTTVGMSEDSTPSAFSLTLNATDIDNTGPQLTWSIFSGASHGTATASGTGLSKSIGYTPNANYNGADSFVVQVSDGTLADTITVNVTLTPINDAPVCVDVPLVIPQDTPGSVVPGCTDVDLDTLTHSIVSPASHGSASAGTNILNYTPNAGYVGSDSFTYRANDGTVNSNTSSVNVTVNHVNHVPVIAEGASTSVTMSEDGSPTAFSLTLNASDPDGDTLTWSISSGAAHGTASASGTGSSKAIGYAPNANYNGSDSFIVQVSDGNGGLDTITVNVTISPINDTPVCAALPLSTAEDTQGEISPSCTDADGDSLSYSIVGAASHGAATVVAGKLRYMPAANYNGSDSFTYKANDGTVDSNIPTVTVTVTAVNDAPVCAALPLSTAEDTQGEISPSCTDADTGDVLTYSIVTPASSGTAAVVSGKLRYTPSANFNGADSFIYKANDTHADSNAALITVTVTAVNDAPVCTARSLTTTEDTQGEVTPSCSDVDGNPLTYSTGTAGHGSTSVVSGNLRYVPDANYNGGDTFTYKANDGTVDSANATVTVTVTAVNDAPVCNPVSITTNEDTMGQVAASCNDVDGNPLTYSVGVAIHGTTSVSANMLRYTPQANYNGVDSFTYKANDGTADSNSPAVSVTVNPVNDAPVITESDPAAVSMSENGAPVAFALTLNATDIEGNTLTWSIFTPASHGTATASGTGNSKAIAYTPSTNYSGGESFVVRVSDGNGGTDNITVNVTISEVFRTISGNAGVGEAVLNYTDRTPKQAVADGSGAYSLQVHYNWSGDVTPVKEGFTFSPALTSYTNVTTNVAGQNYTANEITFTISGNAGVAGAVLSFPGGTEVADTTGDYEIGISYEWDGEVTPSLAGYTFFPTSMVYADVLSDQVDQDYAVRAPSDMWKVLSKRPVFLWPAIPGADKYQLQVSQYSNFQTNLLDKMPTPPTYLPVSDLPTGKYLYWRYRPITGTTPGSWEPVWSFIIPPPALTAPVLISPATNLLTPVNDITFGWKTVLGGAKYELLISKSSSFATVERDIIDLTPVGPMSLDMSYAANDLPDAKYYWKVRAFNALNVPGNWSSTRILTIDTTAPLPLVLKLPAADAIATGTPSYSWNTSVGASRYQFGYDAAGCTDPAYKSLELSTTSVKPPTQPVGDWFWCARAKDAAGNWSPWSTERKVTIKPTVPVAPVLSSPVNGLITMDPTPDFNWAGVPYGSTYQIQISPTSTFLLTWQDSTGGPGVLTYTASPLTDGKYYWRVRAINSLSTAGPWSTVRNFTVDTSAPAAPVLKLPAADAVVGGIPTYSWNTSTGANKYQFGFDPAGCADPVNKSAVLTVTSYKPAVQGAGAWHWCVRAGDAAGNWSSWSERVITVNPIKPVAPALIAPAANIVTKSSRPVFNWGSVLYGETYQIQVSTSSTFLTTEKSESVAALTYTPNSDLPDGKHYWRVRASNTLAGDGAWSTVRSLTIDTAIPPAPVLKLPLDLATVVGTPTYSWNASSGANGYRFGYDPANCADPVNKSGWITALTYKPSTQAVGTWRWCVQARDAVGNESGWSERTITINPTVPVAPALVSPASGGLTGDSTPTFTWNSVAYGDTYQIQISLSSTFASYEQQVTGAPGVLNYTATTLPDGKHYWRVRAYNSLSAAGPWSAARNFTVDTTPPAVPVLSQPLNLSVVTAIPAYSWLASPGANRYQFRYDTHADCASPMYESAELTVLNHKPASQSFGTYYWCVSARDAAGNWSAWSAPNKLILTPF